MSDRPVSGATNPGVRFERSDVDAAALLRFGLILVLATVLVVLLLWRLYYVFLAQEAARQPPPPVMKVDPARMAPPPPLLQTAPALDLATYRAEQDRFLASYGWIDRDQEVVRIPIAEAMRLVAEQGLPVWAAPEAAASPAPDPSPAGREGKPAHAGARR